MEDARGLKGGGILLAAGPVRKSALLGSRLWLSLYSATGGQIEFMID